MGSFQRELTRRDVLKLGLGAAVFGTAAAFMPQLLSFGEGDSGDIETGDDHGGGTDTGSWEKAGNAFVWFDAGGFYGHGDPEYMKNPKQGWDDDSIETFIRLMEVEMTRIRNKNMVLENYTRWHGQTDREYIRGICRSALDKARDRATRRAQELGIYYSGKARIVGVGWTYCAGHKNADGGWSLPHGGNGFGLVYGWNESYTDIITRAGKVSTFDVSGSPETTYVHGSHEFLRAAGWNSTVDDPEYEGLSWTNYIYRKGVDDSEGKTGLVFIAHAVADGEMYGSLTVKKIVNGSPTNRAFKFTATFTSPEGRQTTRTFNLRHGESKTFDDLEFGTRYSITEDSDYEITWVNRTGTINKTNRKAECTCTNSVGYLKLTKDVTD